MTDRQTASVQGEGRACKHKGAASGVIRKGG